jgi:type-F conjugative transfer system mating-pair stabilization protein TraN
MRLKPRTFLLIYTFCSIFLGLLFCDKTFADPWRNLKSGDQAAQEFLSKIDQKKSEGGISPFYKGIPSEASLDAAELRGKAQTLSIKDPASKMIFGSSEARSQFKIDPHKDPLLRDTEKIGQKPLETIGGKGTKVTRIEHKGRDEILACEEAGDDSLETCVRELHVKIIKTKVQKEWNGNFYISKCSVGEKDGHYIPCGALRYALFEARWALNGFGLKRQGLDINASLNITAAYKACVREAAVKKSFGCSQCSVALPGLPSPLDQVQNITLLKHPHNGKHLYTKVEHVHTYNSGRTEYYFQPYIKVLYEKEEIQVLPDNWISNCSRLEEKVDQGLCSYDSKACTQGRQTHTIEGIPITRDCWQETYTYSCSYPAKNDCGPLRARGCAQISSACQQKVGNTCVVYSQTYQCRGNATPGLTDSITGGNTPFCLDGNCRDQGYEVNNEMMATLAQLSLLKEMQGQFKNGTIFKGEDNRCAKCIVSFKDCCGSGKGWGKSIGLTDCSPEERLLKEKRNAGLCHYVGTYCAEKIPIIGCIKKKSTYCCFGSKLLKAFHEQGRPQIGLGWGEAKEPLCRGFTVEEIQKIDFSKLDLREIYEDLMKNFNPSKMNDISKHVGERINIIKKGLEDKTLESKTFEPKALDSKEKPSSQTKEPFKQRNEE